MTMQEIVEIRPEASLQQLMSYPQVGVIVTPLGLTIRVVLAPGLIISQDVNKDVMDQVVAQWHKLYPPEQKGT